MTDPTKQSGWGGYRSVLMSGCRTAVILFLVVLFTTPALGQAAQTDDADDPYKPVLDRLESLTVLPLHCWRFHADVRHPEDPDVDDSGWEFMKLHDKWKGGSRALRLWIEIPEIVNGYRVRGSRVKLDLFLTSPGRGF